MRGNASVKIATPVPGQAIGNPNCGTGGFLLAAHDFISQHNKLSKPELKHLRTQTLLGTDIVPGVVSLCAMNLYLHGIGSTADANDLSAGASAKEGPPVDRAPSPLRACSRGHSTLVCSSSIADSLQLQDRPMKSKSASPAGAKVPKKNAKAASSVKPVVRKRKIIAEDAAEYKAGKLRFIDLFCGIGGFRIAFEKAAANCVFSSDYDKFSQTTYEANFGERPHGDINEVKVSDIPAHDILCAGFPCQPFSIAGVSKKASLGRLHGFDDVKQGNLFFSIAAILEHHRPAAFVLENVKNLKSHDKGRTFEVISRTLTETLGYTVYHEIIDARSVVPQHRERIFLVGFREPRRFEFPVFPNVGPKLGSILESKPDPKYTLTTHLWTYLQNYAAKHKAAGNGFGFGLVTAKDTTRTLSARYHKDGSEILIAQKGRNPRRLTPRECARLMGYPDDYKVVVSDTQAYRQFGNSVVVPVVERIAAEVKAALMRDAEPGFFLREEEKKSSAEGARRRKAKIPKADCS